MTVAEDRGHADRNADAAPGRLFDRQPALERFWEGAAGRRERLGAHCDRARRTACCRAGEPQGLTGHDGLPQKHPDDGEHRQQRHQLNRRLPALTLVPSHRARVARLG